MAKQTILVGTAGNDRTGDPLRTAFIKANSNFTELYSAAVQGTQGVQGRQGIQGPVGAGTQGTQGTSGGGVTNKLTNGSYEITLESAGAVTFPTLTVPISDNAVPSGTGQTLKFSDSSQQAIIYGPESTSEAISAQRIIIQGAPGYTGTGGEGGDVYLWAGPGGDTDGGGGDIKVRAGRGDGTGQGGYLKFQAGDSSTGNGGQIIIESGSTGTYADGGDITVKAHSGGEITLRTSNSDGSNNNWFFGNDNKLILPLGGTIDEISNTLVLTPPTALAGQSLAIRGTSPTGITSDHPGGFTPGDTITITVTPDNGNVVTGTVDYTFTGDFGVGELGTNTTGTLTFTSEAGQILTWTIPALSGMTTFTFTLSNSAGIGLGGLTDLTVTRTGSSEDSHVHLVSGNPTTIDIYLGDDDQYVKIEKNGGDVVIGTNTDTKHWRFDIDGKLTLPGTGFIDTSSGEVNIVSDNNYTQLQNNSNNGTSYIWVENGTASIETPNGVWIFKADGATVYPADSIPTTSRGAAGDQIGSVVFGPSYIYYCFQNYSTGSSDIWKRIAWSNDTW